MREALDALRLAAGLLSRREHSVAELRAKLLGRGLSADETERTLAKFVEQNLLSDSRFVEQYVASAMRRGRGPVKIRHELRTRGVDASLIDGQFEALEEQWREVCWQAAEKKFGRRLIADQKDLAKRFRFLQSRGFNSDQIRYCQSRWNHP